jgi:CheY-like chemotaxis protein
MFNVLIADDNSEDRELLRMEIEKALAGKNSLIKFYEASNVKKALELLKARHMDLLTLDIEFDRLSEGIDVLPEIFEDHPTLNIIVISGKLNKNEVTERLFRFTKDNVLKSKRWVRHFDVLDKKDNKNDAVARAYAFAVRQKEAAGTVHDLFMLAESHLEKDEMDKCLTVYKKIQSIVPDEAESKENINLFHDTVTPEKIVQYMRQGDTIVASLLLGHYIEIRLKAFTRKRLGRAYAVLSDCLKELEQARKIKTFKWELFSNLLRMRNKAIHRPSGVTEEEVQEVFRSIGLLEAKY